MTFILSDMLTLKILVKIGSQRFYNHGLYSTNVSEPEAFTMLSKSRPLLPDLEVLELLEYSILLS